MRYQPIESYGMIGDMHSVALISTQGSIDWLCFPHFDSPAIFAALLDDARGGRFSIAPSPTVSPTSSFTGLIPTCSSRASSTVTASAR